MGSTATVVVTGGSGRLGTALQSLLPHAVFLSKQSLDVSNPGACKAWFNGWRPSLIIHLAAETRHNAPWESYVANNIQGTLNVAQWARRTGARLVYTSTDYVYPGDTGHYRESDAIRPINAYAWSKLAGECIVSGLENALTVRGSWYSGFAPERAATDAFTSKLPVHLAALHVVELACSAATGVVNIGGARKSLFEIALEANPRVRPCLRADLNLPYPLPQDTSLDTTRARSLGVR